VSSALTSAAWQDQQEALTATACWHMGKALQGVALLHLLPTFSLR